MQIVHVPYAQLRVSSANPRRRGIDVESIDELAIHIGLHGLGNPLRVVAYGDGYEVDAGQRRFLALGRLLEWLHCGGRPAGLGLDGAEFALLLPLAAELEDAVPCIVIEAPTADRPLDALADNLHHADMHSYDVAETLIARLARNIPGDSLTAIGRRIGRSQTYVSKMVATYRGACAELHQAWEHGPLSYEQVKALAELPHDQQRARLAGAPAGKSHGRPGVERLKDLRDVARNAVVRTTDPYVRGVHDALEAALGDRPLLELERKLEGETP